MIDKRTASFLGMAFAFSWGVSFVGIALGITTASGMRYMLVAGASMFGPALAALVQARLIERQPWSALGVQGRPFPVGMLLRTALLGVCIVPAILVVNAVGHALLPSAGFSVVAMGTEQLLVRLTELSELLGRGAPSASSVEKLKAIPPMVLLAGALVSSVFAACTINLPFMLGEELGWRGYLFHRLRERSGLQRVLFTGPVWGLWHAPLIAVGHNYPGYPVAGIGAMMVFCTALALLFDWTRFRSGSIWSSGLLHGIINGSAGVLALFLGGGHILVGSPAGLSGVLAGLLLGAAILSLDGTYRRAFLAQPMASTATRT